MDFILRTFLEFLNWTDKARCLKYIDHVLVHKRNAKWVAFLHINMAEVEITNWTSSTNQMEFDLSHLLAAKLEVKFFLEGESIVGILVEGNTE